MGSNSYAGSEDRQRRKPETRQEETANSINNIISVENLLEQSGTFLVDVLDNFQDGIFALNKEWNFTYLNKCAANIVGLKPKDLVGKNIWKTYPQLKGTVIEENYRLATQTQQTKRFETTSISGRAWFEITVYPSKEGIIVQWHDITERKRAEQQLLEAKNQAEQDRRNLYTTLEALPFAVVILAKPTLRYIYANRHAKELYGFDTFGLSLSENVAKAKPKQLDGTPYPTKELPIYRALHGQASTNVEMVLERPDGTAYPIFAGAAPLVNAEGVVFAAVAIFEDITERIRTQETLRLSEERFSKAFKASPAALVITRLVDGYFVDVNEAFLRMLEHSREEIAGHKSTEIKMYTDPNQRAELVKRLQEQGKVRNLEVNLQTKTGKPLIVLVSIDKISLNNQEHTLSTLIDITERKKAEETLQRQADLIDLSPDAIIVRKLDGTISFWSKGAEKLYGWTKQEAIGQRIHSILNTKFPQPYEEIVEQLKQTERWSGELIHETKYGQKVTVQSYWLARLKNGQIVEIFESNVDITERRQAEEALRQSEQHLRFHTEYSPLAVLEWDANFIVTRWAGAAQKMFGWSAQETVGRPIMTLKMIYEPDVPIVERTMAKLTSGVERQVVSSNRNVTKDGRVLYCTWYNSVLTDPSGRMVSVMSLVEDDTARVRAEEELKRTNENLEQLVEERTKRLQDAQRLATIGQVAGMVGHDIRNPLQNIATELYFARKSVAKTQDKEAQKALENVDAIQVQVDYISKIVADMQDLAKPLKPELIEVDVCRLISEVLKTINVPANVEVSVVCEEPSIKLSLDATFMRRILTNLANNAIQAMPKGGKLTARASYKDASAFIVVEDTGVGIPLEAQAKLFTPLFTTKAKGQGFGLVSVKRMVEALGGTISFESQVGKGTKFIVSLPKEMAEKADT